MRFQAGARRRKVLGEEGPWAESLPVHFSSPLHHGFSGVSLSQRFGIQECWASQPFFLFLFFKLSIFFYFGIRAYEETVDWILIHEDLKP